MRILAHCTPLHHETGASLLHVLAWIALLTCVIATGACLIRRFAGSDAKEADDVRNG